MDVAEISNDTDYYRQAYQEKLNEIHDKLGEFMLLEEEVYNTLSSKVRRLQRHHKKMNELPERNKHLNIELGTEIAEAMQEEREHYQDPTEIIKLNVGGKKYSTEVQILLKYKDSILARLFSGNYTLAQDDRGRIFIDRDGAAFGYVLDRLQNGRNWNPPTKQYMQSLVRQEFLFWGINWEEEENECEDLTPQCAVITQPGKEQIINIAKTVNTNNKDTDTATSTVRNIINNITLNNHNLNVLQGREEDNMSSDGKEDNQDASSTTTSTRSPLSTPTSTPSSSPAQVRVEDSSSATPSSFTTPSPVQLTGEYSSSTTSTPSSPVQHSSPISSPDQPEADFTSQRVELSSSSPTVATTSSTTMEPEVVVEEKQAVNTATNQQPNPNDFYSMLMSLC